MKYTLLSALLLAGLGFGCSKNSPVPTLSTPALTGGTWTGVSGTLVSTNKITGMVSTQPSMSVPSAVKKAYGADGKYTLTVDKSASSTGADYVSTGTYTYSGGIITYSSIGTSTSKVEKLTATELVEVTTSEDSSTRFVGTDTWKR